MNNKEKAKGIFKAYPDQDEVHITPDGQAFVSEPAARSHHPQFESFKRSDFATTPVVKKTAEELEAEAAEKAAKEAEQKAAAEAKKIAAAEAKKKAEAEKKASGK